MPFTFVPDRPLWEIGAAGYFADYARHRNAFLASRGSFTIVEDDDGTAQVVEDEAPERERSTRVTAANRKIEPTELGISPKKAWKAAVDLGWRVNCWLVEIEVGPVLYVSDSGESAEKSYSAGDVRFEGYAGRLYTIEARHPILGLGFRARYLGKGDGKTASFENALVRDPEGVSVPNVVDYTKDKRTAKELNWTEEMRVQMGMATNARINDGTHRLAEAHLFSAAGEFIAWLDKWKTRKGGQ